MKKKMIQVLVLLAVCRSMQAQLVSPVAQIPTKTTGLVLKNLSSLNKSLSPKYIEATKKFMVNATKTRITNNSSASSVLTVTLNKGGSDSPASGTTETQPAQDGAYTCVTRNVNENVDYFNQPLFQNANDFIYPGALFNATDIINNRFTNFLLPANYHRQPYKISADLFTMNGTPVSPVETIGDGAGEDYSLATFRSEFQKILSRNLTANPPVQVLIEYIDANTREEVGVKLGYNFNASIPAELTVLVTGIPVGVNASLGANVVANSSNEKSRLILKINYNFFSVDVSPTNEQFPSLLSPAPGADINNNLVCVSSVLYGSTGYVYFESDKSLSELETAVTEAIGASGPIDVGSASVNVSADTKAKFASTVTKMVACGKGLGIPAGSSQTVTSLDNLFNLIGTLRQWGPNNQGSPIAYTMNFVKDNNQAVVTFNTQFPNKVCTETPLSNLKYDVDLELNRFDVANVRDLDGTEDLFGQFDFKNLKAQSKTNSSDINFWSKPQSQANENNFRNGTAPISKRVNLIKNISFDELRNMELTIGGKLSDDEGIFSPRIFKCSECSTFSGDYGSTTIKFIEESNTQASVNSLVNSGDYQMLKFGGDNFIELNYYESNVKNDGWVKVLWKVWVKPHP